MGPVAGMTPRAKALTRRADHAGSPFTPGPTKNPDRPMRTATVSLTLTRSMIRYAVARGARLDTLCAAAGITPEQLTQPDQRITGEQSQRAWDAAVTATKDQDFGLHLGELAQPATLGLVGFVMVSAPDLGAALRALLRYTNLLTNGVRGALVERGGEAALELSPVGELENALVSAPRQRIESTLSACVALAFGLTGKRLPVTGVSFVHPEPASPAEHRRIFRAPVAFGRPVNRLAFAAEAQRWPLLDANPALLESFETQARESLARLDQVDTWTARTQREIARTLRGEAPELAAVARALGVSARDLQRKLGGEGGSFRAALDAVRESLARRHLRDRNATVEEISFLLAFSEPSAFHRSFKRWTGLTPQAFRAQAETGNGA